MQPSALMRDTKSTQNSQNSSSSSSSQGLRGMISDSRVVNSQSHGNILRSSSQASFARNPRAEYEQQQQQQHNSIQQFSLSRAEHFQSEMCQLMDSFDRLREEKSQLKWRLSQRNEDLLQRITASLPSECTDKFLKSLSKRSIHLESVGDVAMSVCMQDQFEATCSKAAQLEMRNMRALIRIQFEKLKAQQKIIADCSTRMQNQAKILSTTQAQLSEKSQHILALQQHTLSQQKQLIAARTSNTPTPQQQVRQFENKNTEDKLTQHAVLKPQMQQQQQQQIPPHQRTYSSQMNQIPSQQLLLTATSLIQENSNLKEAAATSKQSQCQSSPEQQFSHPKPCSKLDRNQSEQSEINLNSNESHRGISSHISIKDFNQPLSSSSNNLNRGSSMNTEIGGVTALTATGQSSDLNSEQRQLRQKVEQSHSRKQSSKENDFPLQIESRIQVQKNKQLNQNSNQLLNLSQNSHPSSQNKHHSHSVITEPKINVLDYENLTCLSQTLRRGNSPPILTTDRSELGSSLEVLNELQPRDQNLMHLPLQQIRRSQSQLLPNAKFQKSEELNRNLKQNNFSVSTENQSQNVQKAQLALVVNKHNNDGNSTKKLTTQLKGSPNITLQNNSSYSAQRFLQPDSTRSQYSLPALSHRSFNEHHFRSPIDELKNSTINSNINCSPIIMVTDGNSTLLTEPNLSSSNNKNESKSSSRNSNNTNQLNQLNQTGRSATSGRRSRAERLQKCSGSNQNLSESVNNDYNTFNPQK